ncbi:MAG: SAM-dependent methyltransferase [Syntrophomonadaceae bacterium]|nr:SAM-dependent methyltransferase [Syntrophomonadaceae bacterium]
MHEMTVKTIGEVFVTDDDAGIILKREYLPAMTGLEGFSHIQLLWWFNGCDNDECRASVTEKRPYHNGPEELGVFATRSPLRPNPIALSCAGVTYIDHDNGVIGLAYVDADHGSPVLDIKPYTPSLDRVESPRVPDWCAHWPQSCEESGDFDWESEFNF